MCRILHPPSRRRPRYHLRPRKADGVWTVFALFPLVLFLLAADTAPAVTLDFPITVDTHVDSRSSNGSDNWNFGSDHTDKVAINSSDSPASRCRALFRLPEELWLYAPSQIVSATVIFYVWQDNSGTRGVNLFPMTSPFAQGTFSKYEQPNPVDGATWWTRDGTNLWTTPGGDFDTNFPVAGIKDEILDESMHDRFFHWDITALLTHAAARTNLQNHGALLRIDEDPVPSSGTQYWAAFTSSHDPAYQPPYQPRLQLVINPAPAIPFHLAVSTNGTVAFGISNLTTQTTNLLEQSTRLTPSNGWSVVTSFVASAGMTNWTLPLLPQATSAFYRVRTLP